jgi:hypothetical protein
MKPMSASRPVMSNACFCKATACSVTPAKSAKLAIINRRTGPKRRTLPSV